MGGAIQDIVKMNKIEFGDCLDVLRTFAPSSIDAIVTDPPYGLSFMGKKWDYDVPSVEIWTECLRVLKPGGHLLAFAGTRTQHRMAVRIEDAGFEIRDMIAWVYGSGFPKSMDVSKAIDKVGGDNFMEWFPEWLEEYRVRAGISRSALADHFPSKSGGRTGCVWNWEHGIRTPSASQFNQLCKLLGIPVQPLEVVERQVLEQRRGVTKTFNVGSTDTIKQRNPITAPATDAARQWQGWGTALKPALEPITVARKPLIGTVASNVLAHGTGALNIDGCRVASNDGYTENAVTQGVNTARTSYEHRRERRTFVPSESGRWPANLIHDGSDEPATLLGDAARFFYCAKASKSDRGAENTHPTVKPTDLMRYLCRLVTPPGGVVLDPFMGSGTTGKAAMLEGFQFIGIERDPAYFEVARERLGLPDELY